MRKLFPLALVFFIVLPGCNKPADLIRSPERMADIQRMLETQKKLTKNSRIPIWDIFDQPLTANEKQALEFLYAYMPLSDLADYPATFFLSNVQQSLKARKEMTWSDSIPEEVYMHFVLPLRVNNENLDSFRLVMYDEIADRIKGLSMADAALEINHWCHEKVAYRGTDSRTSAPLSTIKKSFGRCGEESTFTVSAMRAAGIPARQVYTPRWAHVDDNHAWVEVWIDGKWQYLGACEPEPMLNMGWFDEPSRRTMLVHSRTYGRYFGSEEVVTMTDRFSELNLTSNYAPVKKITVLVKNADGTPSDSARVDFTLYNYAEYYPIAIKYTDDQGITDLTTGMGDLLVWASSKEFFNYQKLSVPVTDTLILMLDKTSLQPHTEVYDMVPPHAVQVKGKASADIKKINQHRLELEDSIRQAYMSTFKDSAWSADFAAGLKLDRDTVFHMIAKSYGNWPEIKAYLEKNSTAYRSSVLAMADKLSNKDFSDTRESILTDHLRASVNMGGIDRETFENYILSPRIQLEQLSPWRTFLHERLGYLEQPGRNDIAVITAWINDSIQIDELANNHSRAPLTPIGVYNLRVADPVSRDIFFVAMCRTFGIPARINPVTRVPEYMNDNTWLRADFGNSSPKQSVQGFLQLTQKNNPIIPQYYLHFTIAVFQEGRYNTLEFEDGRKLNDFPASLPLDTGKYLLVTGNRMEDGTVLSTLTFFTIDEGKRTIVPVILRENAGEIKPSGKLDLGRLMLQPTDQDVPQSLAGLSAGKNLVIVLLDPGLEPSKHILNDLTPYVEHFNKWNGLFIFAASEEKNLLNSVLKSYTLPQKNISGTDLNDNILNEVNTIYGPGIQEKLPLVLLCDNKGNVYLFSAGYKIGIGEQILKLAR